MGLIKNIVSITSKLAGGVIGGTVEIIGEATNSDFIKDIGQGVYQVSSKSGELLGNLAEGTVDTVVGVISDDDYLKNKGKDQFVNAAGDTIKGVANGVVTVTKKGIHTAGAILDGDKEKAIECGKDLVKIAAVSALSIGVIDVLDGVDVIDVADHMAISDGVDLDDTVDADFDDATVENPNIHSVTPHWRTLSDGKEIWVDGDGDTSVNTGDGWTQHNPDYKSI
ncbi:MAG: hypothetical protein E7211_10320 [Clostridium lundense]|nr:hypothetical protein [Clostridium lundense]